MLQSMIDIEKYREIVNDQLSEDEQSHIRPWWRPCIFAMLSGKRIRDIATTFNVHPNTISYLRHNNTVFMKLYSILNHGQEFEAMQHREAVQSAVQTSSEKAALVLEELMDSEDTPASVRYNSAREILHIAGHKPREVIDLTTDNEHRITMSGGMTGYDPSTDPFYTKTPSEVDTPTDRVKSSEELALDELTLLDKRYIDSDEI